MKRFTPTACGLSFVLMLAAAGCDTLFTPTDPSRVSLSFAVPQASSPSFAVLPSTDIVTGGGNTLDLRQVQVSFSEIALERAGAAGANADSDSDSDESGDEVVRRGPITIDLPLSGGVVSLLTEPLPSGIYEEIELEIAHVRMLGDFDGASFDVTLPVEAELEIAFAPPLEIGGGADELSITITIDAHSWFRQADGSLVDPRLVLESPALREFLIERIEDSFDAFEDSDRDADDSDSDSDSDSR